MQFSLLDEDAQVLGDALTEYVSDLRMEIADTDQMDWREKLKGRELVLNRVIAALAAAGARRG